MGIWTGIKHAINSTLGTADFKPLDKIIEGQRTLAASDSIIKVISSTSKNIDTASRSFGTFMPKVDGSVRVILNYNSEKETSETCELDIEEEGTLIASKKNKTYNSGTDFIFFVDVNVKKNNVYTIKIFASRSMTAKAIEIGASIVDTNLIETEV